MNRIGIVLLLLGGACLTGCQQQPFINELHRTPYERYMALRGRERPVSHRNEYGLEVRNTRERLKPLEE